MVAHRPFSLNCLKILCVPRAHPPAPQTLAAAHLDPVSIASLSPSHRVVEVLQLGHTGSFHFVLCAQAASFLGDKWSLTPHKVVLHKAASSS